MCAFLALLLGSPAPAWAQDADGDGIPDAVDVCPDAPPAALGGPFPVPGRFLTDRLRGEVVHEVTDLDGDGALDLLVGSAEDDAVVWYRTLGNGALAAQGDVAAGVDVAAVHAVDLDGDGDRDVVFAGRADGTIGWAENLGGGAFWGWHTLSVETEPVSVSSADLDGDGDADLLFADAGAASLGTIENLGGGSFGPATVVASIAAPEGVLGADLDGDGDADVLTLLPDADAWAWAENLGGGAFGALQTISDGTTRPATLEAPDLDGDGDADVLVASDEGAVWFENTGGGTFAASQRLQGPYPGGGRTESAFTTDLDGDGDPDVVALNRSNDISPDPNSTYAVWFENQGGGVFAGGFVTGGYYASGDSGTDDLAPLDLDADGDLDLVAVRQAPQQPLWYESLGGGSFAYGVRFLVLQTTDDPDATQVVDLDGDCDPDVLTASHQLGPSWYENLGAGRFTAPHVIGDESVEVLRALDLDGDGDRDVLALRYRGGLAWYENLGGGAWAPIVDIDTTLSAHALETADLDGDGDEDLLTTPAEAAGASWRENLGGAAFGPEQPFTPAPPNPSAITAADLDADGDLDVLAHGLSTAEVLWYDNLGGTFAAGVPLVEAGSAGPSVVDFDGDGDLDVLTGAPGLGIVGWHENLGGGFAAPQVVGQLADGSILDVDAADVDLDGDIDVLVVREAAPWPQPELVWFENQGGGAFQDVALYPTPTYGGLAVVHRADLDADGDGDPDLFLTADDAILWLENQTVPTDADADALCDLSDPCPWDPDPACVVGTDTPWAGPGCPPPAGTDTGTPTTDTGSATGVPTDTGSATGVPTDTGSVTGAPTGDTDPPGGTTGSEPDPGSRGCGCSSTAPAPPWVTSALIGVLLGARRRRRGGPGRVS